MSLKRYRCDPKWVGSLKGKAYHSSLSLWVVEKLGNFVSHFLCQPCFSVSLYTFNISLSITHILQGKWERQGPLQVNWTNFRKKQKIFRVQKLTLGNYCWLTVWGPQTWNYWILQGPLEVEALRQGAPCLSLLVVLLLGSRTQKQRHLKMIVHAVYMHKSIFHLVLNE